MAMDVFERLNRRFGVWYEGLFGGSDNRDLRPRDILRRILTAMEDNRREGLDGQIYVPNVYTVQIAVESDDERDYLRSFLSADELAAAVLRAVEQHGYGLRGPLLFTVEEADAVPTKGVPGAQRPEKARVRCRFDAQAAPSPVTPPTPTPARASVSAPITATATTPPDDEDEEPGTLPASHTATLASLVVRGPEGRLLDVFPIGARGVRFGRGRQAGNDIVLEGDGMISKRHARITYEQGQFVLYDENSTNGTAVNGQTVRPGHGVPLNPGDEVRAGATTLLLRPAQVPPVREGAGPLTPNNGGTRGDEAAPPVSGSPTPAGRFESGLAGGGGGGFRLVAGDGETFLLASEMIVGRVLTADIVLLGNGVSSQHARLSVRGDAVYVEDFDALGGTFVNGERIPARFPVALYDGDQVAFGEVMLRLERGPDRNTVFGGRGTGYQA